MGQRQREADVAAAELRRQRQQFDGIFWVAGFRLTAAQQLPGDEGAARAGCKALTVVEGGDARVAEDGVAGDIVCAAAQCVRKAGKGRGHQEKVFPDQKHTDGAAEGFGAEAVRQ